MRIIAFTFVVSSLLLLAEQCVAKQRESTQEIESFGEDQSVVYKQCEGEHLKLYLFMPAEKKLKVGRPAIVFFFGGGWVGGTPAQFKQHAAYLKSRGMIAVLADYRTRKSHGTSPKECVADAKSAVRFLRVNANRFGIDPDQIVAAGGSAGGHIAAATATVTRFDETKEANTASSVPCAMILFNPVFNNGPGQWGHKVVNDYWRDISPAHNIQKGIPPVIVFLGDNDKLISVATAVDFRKKMTSVGAQSELHIYKGKGHGFFNFGRGGNQDFIDTVEKMDQFLVGLGILEGHCTIQDFLDQD